MSNSEQETSSLSELNIESAHQTTLIVKNSSLESLTYWMEYQAVQVLKQDGYKVEISKKKFQRIFTIAKGQSGNHERVIVAVRKYQDKRLWLTYFYWGEFGPAFSLLYKFVLERFGADPLPPSEHLKGRPEQQESQPSTQQPPAIEGNSMTPTATEAKRQEAKPQKLGRRKNKQRMRILCGLVRWHSERAEKSIDDACDECKLVSRTTYYNYQSEGLVYSIQDIEAMGTDFQTLWSSFTKGALDEDIESLLTGHWKRGLNVD